MIYYLFVVQSNEWLSIFIAFVAMYVCACNWCFQTHTQVMIQTRLLINGDCLGLILNERTYKNNTLTGKDVGTFLS